jgi:RNA polymerase sigma factor (sigma-70 family)
VDESIPPAGSSEEPPRTELQQRLDNGESPREILEDLYRRFHGKLLAFVRTLMRNAADAEDVVSEVFLKMQRRFDDVKTVKSLDGWIITVARRQCYDFYRRAKETPVDPEIVGENWSDRSGDGQVGPGERAEQADAGEQLRAHVLALAERGSIGRADLGDVWNQVVMKVRQQDLADERGVTQSRIAQRKGDLLREVRISFYLCHVLGTVRPPYPAAAIHVHLDIFDLDPGPLKDADRKLLRRAGDVVVRGPGGEVVLRREDAKAAMENPKPGPVASLAELHDAESVYAVAIGNPAPRCIASPCTQHQASAGMGGEAR